MGDVFWLTVIAIKETEIIAWWDFSQVKYQEVLTFIWSHLQYFVSHKLNEPEAAPQYFPSYECHQM